jgi:signal transduction histidine kinase
VTPDAVIYRYLQLVATSEVDVDQLCLLLSADADLLTRWLKLLSLPADLGALRAHITDLDQEDFKGLAHSQAWAVQPIAGSARLSLEQWLAVLRAACLAEALWDHLAGESRTDRGTAAAGTGANVRLRALLAISGVHLPQDESLSTLIEFRGTNPALLEDATLELKVFAVVDALEVGREVELAGDLLGVSVDTFATLLQAAEAASQRLVQRLGIDLSSDVDWAHRIWLRQQIGVMAAGFRLCEDLQAFNILHQLVTRCLFAQPPLLLCQEDATGPLVLLNDAGLTIGVHSRTSMVAASMRNGRAMVLQDGADLAVVDRQLLRLLDAEEALALPVVHEVPVAVMLIALEEDSDVETAAELYADEVAPHLARALAGGQTTEAHDELALVEEFRASEYKRLREIVHEANNPLAIVHNYLHILELRLQQDPEVVEQLEMIAAELRRAGEVFTRAREIPQQIQTESPDTGEISEFDVGRWVGNLAELHSGYAAEHGVDLHTVLPAQPVVIATQADKLTQIVSNLVKNAIEACEPGDDVTVGVRGSVFREDRLGMELFVQDTGAGLTNEVLQNLTVAKRSSKGGDHQGIGLQVAFKLTAELDGALDVRTELGQGTTFSLFLPLG